MSLRGILNAEGIFALVWLMIALFGSVKKVELAGVENRRWLWLLLLVPLPFLPFLTFPFLADDYVHILYARHLNASAIVDLFTVPAGDSFFRPAGYLAYGLDALWAGMSPGLWRFSSLLLHCANAVLVCLLCRTLDFRIAPAVFAGLLFGIHGSRPEAVTWVAARFDLLAVFFGIGCLLLLLRNRSAFACLALFAAVLSKESAFVVPLLAVAVLWFTGRNRADIARITAPLFLIALVVFTYRWHLLGGIGGYRNAVNGAPQVFQFRFATTLQALLPRLWGTLLFPINWTSQPGAIVLGLMVLASIGFLWLALARPMRRAFLLGFIFVYLCALPVHQFLSIGADLEKARVLYFASAGFAILFASMIGKSRLLLPATFVLLFQCAALEHNLSVWKRVGYQAREACRAGARDLPNVVSGVYFLHTGYPECLEFR